MRETRHQFREDLKATENQVVGGIDIVIDQLDRALEAVAQQDVELAALVVADDDRIDGRYLEVHQSVLSLLARQAPVAGDLRIVAALLHVVRCMERMGDQCANIAKLVPLSGYETPSDTLVLDEIEQMGRLARVQLVQSRDALATRDLHRARLVAQDAESRANREIFDVRSRSAITSRSANGRCTWSWSPDAWNGSGTTQSTSPNRSSSS